MPPKISPKTADNQITEAGNPHHQTLAAFGWESFFARQISLEELSDTPPVRVVAVHRSGLEVVGVEIDALIPPRADVTVGDWLLLDPARAHASRLLTRKSLIKRRAPGTNRQVQLIAANIDTVFVVTSCNQDFNLARLERYVALAFEAGITPVIVLTKADLAVDAPAWIAAAGGISERAPVVALDARGDEPRQILSPWCQPGQTVAFLGSSGVGKSTLTNALIGRDAITTQAIREDDAKGRHTTTRRALHRIPGGCLVLDTPGMRELQLTDAAAGIADCRTGYIPRPAQPSPRNAASRIASMMASPAARCARPSTMSGSTPRGCGAGAS
jgi:ribosome biogenesis GTPase